MSGPSADHTVVLHVMPGEVLDERWRLEDRVGQGAMGSVFRGKDVKTGALVAVKVLAPEHCRKPKVLARFEREAELMMEVRHPNIVQLLGHGRLRALPYIVMEYLDGMTLSEVLEARGGKLPVAETVALIKPIAAGLAFLHRAGLVHRDIKPQNIFLTARGRVTILDLGVVRDQHNPGL
ncbi:MAG: serine/threonine protein kinase, partial [Archangiaceae bacterium]|nr:serine/threonine protein kinase [Archangiaceae bacterium]